MSLAEVVSEHVKAAFAGMWIQSHEHEDAIEELQRMCAARERSDWTVCHWDLQRGLLGHPEILDQQIVQDSKNPKTGVFFEKPQALLDAFPRIARDSEKSCTLLVLVNFHKHWDNPKYIQTLSNVISQGKAGVRREHVDETANFYVLILSPVVDVPVELDRQFVVLNHELPTKEQLWELMDNVVEKEELPSDDDTKSLVLQAASGLTRYEAEGAVSLSVLRTQDEETRLGRIEPEIIWDVKAKSLKKRGLLELYEGDASFSKMGGMDYFHQFSTKLLGRGVEDPKLFPKGLMLLGVPGSGKTQAVRCLGNDTRRRVLHMRMGTLRSKYVGESDNNLDQALKIADAMAPCILFID